VISRRSRGLSIGINLNPDKICNFDCIYCEVDRVTSPRFKTVDKKILKDELTKIIEAIKSGELSKDVAVSKCRYFTQIKDIAFSGDGEPTMVDGFSAYIKRQRMFARNRGLIRQRLF
jgi:wyosine [tRNA(Phe)-imidazoG37] synthetase (radical SAM superfamily)